jgi:phosphocarrier protein HPr
MGIFGRNRNDSTQQASSKELTIMNRLGMHARPSALFVKTCGRFRCDVWVEKDGEQVNGKSIMGLMMLAAGMGSKLKVTCEGPDADQALVQIEALIERKFDEE